MMIITTMNSITRLHLSSSLLPLNSHHHYHHHSLLLIRQTNLPWLATTRTVEESLHFASARPVMRNALPPSSVFVAASSSTPKPLDISVFLQTSALLLFLYFTANFIVPDLISKYFGFDKVKDNDGDR